MCSIYRKLNYIWVMLALCAMLPTAVQSQTLPVTDNLTLWLDASDISTIQVSQGQLYNGAKISNWQDILIGGNTSAHDATQNDPEKQPVWIQNVLEMNNASAVMFDGSLSYLHLPSLAIGADTTIFIVSQNAIQTPQTSTYHRPMLAADNDPWAIDDVYGDPIGNGYGFSYSRSGPETFHAVLSDGYYLDSINSALPQDYSYSILTFSRDGDAFDGSKMYKRDLHDDSAVLMGANRFWRTSGFNTGYAIGANPPEHGGPEYRYYRGKIFEIIIYDSHLDDQDRQAVEQYLYDKYFVPQVCGHPAMEYMPADLNMDCLIDLKDFSILAQDWLNCSDKLDPFCEQYFEPAHLASKRWHTWRKSRDNFPIGAWAYFRRYGGTLDEYQTYAGANLTMVQTPLSDVRNAIKAGLYPLIGSWETLFNSQTKLQYYLNYPTIADPDRNIAGYDLRDEPRSTEDFQTLAEATKYIYHNDIRNALPQVTLLPDYGTSWTPYFTTHQDYVNAYIEIVKPSVLVTNYYPTLADGTDRPTFYSTLESMREKSLANDIGFMGWALVTVHGNNLYREPSESDLNWNVYSVITYGAHGLWYYNYRIGDDNFEDGLVRHDDGTPTDIYYTVRDVNEEILAMGPILMQLRSTGVYHTGADIPDGTTAYIDGDINVLSDFVGDNFILGEFENIDDPDDNAVYAMVTNKRHSPATTSQQETATASFRSQPASLDVYKFDVAASQWQLLIDTNDIYELEVGGGKGILLKFSSN